VLLPNEAAEARLAGESSAAEAEVGRLNVQLGSIKGEMDALKKARGLGVRCGTAHALTSGAVLQVWQRHQPGVGLGGLGRDTGGATLALALALCQELELFQVYFN